MIKRLVLVFLVLFFTNSAWSQFSDSILTAEKSDYIERLLNHKGPVQYIMGLPNKFVQPKDKFHYEKPQLLIKTDSSLFLSFSGSGRIYKMSGKNDSCYIFSRIDLTENINYNLGANYFSYKEELFSLGGYGFWKTNGNLKFFNPKDKQWDIVPLSEEVIPQFYPIEASWFNYTSGKLFVPLQSIVNAGISGTVYVKGKLIPYSYVLDINKKVWEKLGKTNEKIIDIITNGQVSFRTQSGIIILYYDKVYLIDFNKNHVLISDDGFFNQSLARKGSGDFVYESNGFIYSYNYVTKQSDSLKFNYSNFKDTGLPIWEPVYNFSMYIIVLLFFTIAIGVFYYSKKKKNKSRNTPIPEKNYRIQFTDTEIALISLLIEKVKHKERATINDVNYVLGLKHKNTGLQKKVRSDTFNSINDKFRYISKTDEPLIQSVRSEVDKRYFEYFILSSHLEMISEYI